MNDALFASDATALAALTGESIELMPDGSTGSKVTVTAIVQRMEPSTDEDTAGRMHGATVKVPRAAYAGTLSTKTQMLVALRSGQPQEQARVVRILAVDPGFWTLSVRRSA